MAEMTRGKLFVQKHEAMKAKRITVDEWHDLIAQFVVPRKAFITNKGDYSHGENHRRLYDNTAGDACGTLANGHASYITPATSRWFVWDDPSPNASDEVSAWYRKCSEIAAIHLSASNFYPVLHEAYEDRSAFGICAISAYPGKETVLNFQSHEVGTFCVEENSEGVVDRFSREVEMGIRQIAEKFGEDSFNDTLRESMKAYRESGKNDTHNIVHVIEPRDYKDREPQSRAAKDMPVTSVYVTAKDGHILMESGFTENPHMVSRYLKHSGRNSEYGFSPSWRAMPAIAQVNYLEKVMDFVAEKQAVPPVLIPDYLEGNVDLRGGGQTIFKANRVKGNYGLPQEWANQGRYDIGVDRVKRKQEEINKAFHVDMFKMFEQIERQMTAREVAERSGEKLVQFSPSFMRFTSDFMPMMERIFAILLKAGVFPPPPEDAIGVNRFTGRPDVAAPKVLYVSRVALALESLQNSGIQQMLETVQFVAQFDQAALDNLNSDILVRLVGRNYGVPEEIFNSVEDVEALRQARAETQQRDQQMAMAMEGAKAAGSLGVDVSQLEA